MEKTSKVITCKIEKELGSNSKLDLNKIRRANGIWANWLRIVSAAGLWHYRNLIHVCPVYLFLLIFT
jgi:hypothetical protein